MKWSKYNYLYQTDKSECFLYNSMTNSLLEIDTGTFNDLSTFEKGQIFQSDNEGLSAALRKARAIVENDKDDFYNLKYTYHYERFIRHKLQLTINPTLHCNFRCPYCFEGAKPPVYMTDEVEDAIIDFIRKQKNIDSLYITWFGGEPLMAFDKMLSINNKIKELGYIKYNADIITNGYLLKERVIDELDNLKVNSIQITIDGLEETHDKRRPLISGKGSFQQIIENIDLLQTKKPDFRLGIRVNIDDTNKEEFIEVCKFFYRRYKKHIAVSPGFVSDNEGCKTSNCLMSKDSIAEFIIYLHKKYGFAPSNLYPDNHFSECAV